MAREFKVLDDALNDAIDNGNLDALRRALAAHADAARWLHSGAESAVMMASMSDHCTAVLDLLRAAGLDMAARTPEDEEPGKPIRRADRLLAQSLFSSVPTPRVVRHLLAQGADVNRRDNGRPLLTSFLRQGANIDVDVLDALLEAKPDLNAIDAGGVTALMMAASRDGGGRAEAIERLLARGADPALRDRDGKTAADYAAAVPSPDYLEVLRRHQGAPSGAPAAAAVPMAAHALQPGAFFVLEPVGEPLAWRWSAPARSAAAAHSFVESRYGTSRSPIGPFPVCELLYSTDRKRAADPFAARHAGRAAPGNLVVLTLNALAPEDLYDMSNKSQRPMFIVSGVFDAAAQAAAQALADAQRAWSVVARLESLTMMSDGYPEAVAKVLTG